MEEKKLSYEELNNVCMQLSEQNERMKAHIENLNRQQMFARLEFLFKVLEYKGSFPVEIVEKTVKEVSEIMYPTPAPVVAEDKAEPETEA
jgi:hypothetical protein